MKKTMILAAVMALIASACCNKECEPADNASIVMQNILQRKSVRSYTGDPIPDSVMQDLLHAAMAAPSAMDKRPWHIVVMTDKS